jgi:quinol monooxygenase YgiN
MATQGVKDMISFMTSNPVLDGAPVVHMLEYVDGLEFSRPEVNTTSDPYVIVGQLVYKPDSSTKSLPYWEAVVKTSKANEPKTLVYGIAKDPKDPNNLFTIEAYENEAALKDIHVKSKAIEESIKNTKDLRESLQHTFLKFYAGYLHR